MLNVQMFVQLLVWFPSAWFSVGANSFVEEMSGEWSCVGRLRDCGPFLGAVERAYSWVHCLRHVSSPAGRV